MEAEQNSKEEPSGSSDIEQEMMILGERSRGKGAYSLSAEHFKTIYRFLCRVEEKNTVSEKVGNRFYEVVRDSLRGSDVVSQNGINHVRVLLLEAESTNSGMVIKRIIENWKANDVSGDYIVTYEMEMVRS